MSPMRAVHKRGALSLSLPLDRKCDFGRARINVMVTLIASLVCQPSGVKSFAAFAMAARQGFKYFEASTNRFPPTWRLLPCGAGRPTTLNVKLSLKARKPYF
jgi:hypothetical protein